MADLRFGVDRFIRRGASARPQRLGLVTNDAARLSADASVMSRVALKEAGFRLVRLFSPEHGIAAKEADGAAVRDGVDRATGQPIISLYGEHMRPTSESLAGLDAMVFDVPDVGARFYTYLWTLSHVIDACADAGLPLIVLDRPNPLGGDHDVSEGPLLDLECCASFLGRLDIPIRHGVTVGEFARLWKTEQRSDAQIEVVPVEGWRRGNMWPATGLLFIPTSPAMPSFMSALLYPGMCLFEATNLSVGRGTDLPFQVVGAPRLHPEAVIEQAGDLPGVTLEVCEFTPKVPPHEGDPCRGIRVRVRDAVRVRPVAMGLRLLQALIHQDRLEWSRYPTAANPTGEDHFARLIGRRGIRERLEAGQFDDAAIKEITRAPGWSERVERVRLYQ